jgi:hypothetical protein
MVWQGLHALSLHLLDSVVEEEIYKYRVDVCLGVLSLDLPPDELYSPDTAC